MQSLSHPRTVTGQPSSILVDEFHCPKPHNEYELTLQLTCDLFFLLSSNSWVSSLNRSSVCRVEIAKPSRPSSPSACSTRRTRPNASNRAFGSEPGSTGRKTLKPIWVPEGGQVWARTNAPVSLMS